MAKAKTKDSYGRTINYMRISITDRCNLRCRYCMPDEVDWIPPDEVLTYEEITEVCQEAVKLGITRFKITGGEPLVRKGCPELIRMIKDIPGVELVTLTTNGLLLGEQLEPLLLAGLDAVNISLDTLDAKKYQWITGADKLSDVLSSMEKAVKSGIPVKINAVLQKGINEEEWLPLTNLARRLPLSVRFIEMMPIGYGKMAESISNEELKEVIQTQYGSLTRDAHIYGNGPAVYYSINGFQGNIGFISAIHGKFCEHCNRIRMTATGELKSCLCYEQRFSLKPALLVANKEKRQAEIREILMESIKNKPKMHCFEDTKKITESHPMGQIGG